MASLRYARQTALLASQASQLPQVLRWSQKPGSASHLCGSGLARDGIPAVRQPDRVVCIAGKPAPTGFAVVTKTGVSRVPLCAGLLAMVSLRCASQTALFVSQASQLPLVLRWSQKSGSAAYLCGSGLARDGSPEVRQPDRVVCIAGKPAPTGFAVVTKTGVSRAPLWERACSRGHHRDLPARPYRLHRRQASSHGHCGALKTQCSPTLPGTKKIPLPHDRGISLHIPPLVACS